MLQSGQPLSAQGYEARFGASAAAFLRALVEVATQEVFADATLTPLLKRFCGVYLTDCTRIEASVLPLKVAACLELQQGSLQLSLETLQTHDNASEVAQALLPRGALHVGDLGFFDLKRFAHWRQSGVDWVSRYKTGTLLYTPDGKRLCLERLLNSSARTFTLPVLVGGEQRLPMYLVAQCLDEPTYQERLARLRQHAKRKQRPLSPRQVAVARWTLYLTSVSDLTFAQVHTLYRARWQIERLFKRWKSLAHLTTSSTRDPHRRACEVYAKLLAVLLAHWLTQHYAWRNPALSHDKCFQLLQQNASLFHLVCFRFPSALPLFDALFSLWSAAALLSQRRARPNAVVLWERFDIFA